MLEQVPELDLRSLSPWPADSSYFVHLCSGPAREGDLCDVIERQASLCEVNIIGVRIDPLARVGWQGLWFPDKGCADLLNVQHGLLLLDLLQSGKVVGGFASPPCSTVSRARRVPLVGRKHGPLEMRAPKERRSVAIGSVLFLICLGLLGEIRMQGGWIGLEHPADPGKPFPSFFSSREADLFRTLFGLQYYEAHQCMYGALCQKATGLLLPYSCQPVRAKCHHAWKHEPLIGLGLDGSFRTTPAAKSFARH